MELSGRVDSTKGDVVRGLDRKVQVVHWEFDGCRKGGG